MKKQKKVLVAMSGGVDSTVTAYLLQKKGYAVEGVFFRFHDLKSSKESLQKAKKAAKKLNLELHIKDVRSDFKKKVIGYFLEEYKSGRTPNPCIICNPRMKFKALLSKAKKLKCNAIATGHYARIKKEEDIYFLQRASAEKQDQSYFLYRLSQDILSKLVFPLGSFKTKKEIYLIAKKLGMEKTYNETESSQDVCFIQNESLSDYLKKNLPEKFFKPGLILDPNGNELGKHEGLISYTIGQRKGLCIGGNGPWFVVGFDYNKNALIAGKNKDCFFSGCKIKDLVWSKKPDKKILKSQVRFRSPEVRGELELKKTTANFCFKEKQRAITPGQSIVFYEGKKVIGGGIISNQIK